MGRLDRLRRRHDAPARVLPRDGEFIALFQEGYYRAERNDLVIQVDFTTWGWFHLVTGLLILGAGIGLLVGQTWARIIGVIFAMWSALVNVAFLEAHPVWSTISRSRSTSS